MHMFGLTSHKSMAATRISGMRMLRIGRFPAKPAKSSVHYLRHASAVSAAIAKNMTSVMSQPSELAHQSGSTSDTDSFLDTHNHYSFIAVVALMSLFLVVTISATGLLLAFCRKKNTVFTAAPKTDADSQFELDDIENSDIEMCRGDKGECYYHLSDDYDDDDDEDDDDDKVDDDGVGSESGGRRRGKIKDRRVAKRSKTFPQLQDVIHRCGSGGIRPADGHASDNTKRSHAFTPLIKQNNSTKISGVYRGGPTLNNNNNNNKPRQYAQQNHHGFHYVSGNGGRGHIICHNPRHQHHQQHHNHCPYNFPHYHHLYHARQAKTYIRSGRPHLARLYRNQLPHHGGCSINGSKLQRSHSIHAIPQTGRESQSQSPPDPNHCGVKIRLQNMDKLSFDTKDDSSCTVSTTIPTSTDDDFAMFNDEDDYPQVRTSFSNLKLRLEDDIQVNSDTTTHGDDQVNLIQVVVHRPAQLHDTTDSHRAEISCDAMPEVGATSSHDAAIRQAHESALPATTNDSFSSSETATSFRPRSNTEKSRVSSISDDSRVRTTSVAGVSHSAVKSMKSNTSYTTMHSSCKKPLVHTRRGGNLLSKKRTDVASPDTPATTATSSSTRTTPIYNPLSVRTNKTTSNVSSNSQPVPLSSRSSSSTSSSSHQPLLSRKSSPQMSVTMPVPLPPPPRINTKREPTRSRAKGITTPQSRPTPSTSATLSTSTVSATTETRLAGEITTADNSNKNDNPWTASTESSSAFGNFPANVTSFPSTDGPSSSCLDRTSDPRHQPDVLPRDTLDLTSTVDNAGFYDSASTDNLLPDGAADETDRSTADLLSTGTAMPEGEGKEEGKDDHNDEDNEDDDDDQTTALLK